MKIVLWPLVVLGMLAVWGVERACADTLQWQTPMGTFGLPFTATESLLAYDGINKVAVAGFSLPVYTDPKGIVALQLGAVAGWQTNEALVQPYVALGHDIAREIPFLAQYNSFHLNLFGRWDSGNGKAGAGVGVSYGFGGGTLTAPPTTPAP
jgi:hypothetical protein